VNPATVAKNIRMSELEKETRARFGSLPKKDGVKLDEDNKAPEKEDEKEDIDLWGEIVKSIKSGDESGAKALYGRSKGHKLSEDVAEDGAEMKKLMSAYAELENGFNEVIRLATEHTGIKI
jgi:hypothetical protein